MSETFYRIVLRKNKEYTTGLGGHRFYQIKDEVVLAVRKKSGLKQFSVTDFLVVEFYLDKAPKFYMVHEKELVEYTETLGQTLDLLLE